MPKHVQQDRPGLVENMYHSNQHTNVLVIQTLGDILVEWNAPIPPSQNDFLIHALLAIFRCQINPSFMTKS